MLRRFAIAFPCSIRERGQALVLFAAGLAAFCGLAGMSIDVGHLLYTRTDLQKAADAAALAGAQDLDGTSSGAAAAIATADSYIAANGLASASCRPNCATVNLGTATITVSLSKQVNYYFLKVIGISSGTPTASATAKATPGAIVTGYTWSSPSVAPFTIWGGSRQHEVNPSDLGQPLHVKVGNSYTFLDTGWMGANGTPTAPDWTANGSNNFKGDQDHGEDSPVSEVGDFVTCGGLGSVTAPAVGSTLVVPVVDKASGNSNARTFHIAGWVVVHVDAGCTKQHCSGTVLDPATTAPPAGFVSDGSVEPPSTLSYRAPSSSALIQ